MVTLKKCLLVLSFGFVCSLNAVEPAYYTGEPVYYCKLLSRAIKLKLKSTCVTKMGLLSDEEQAAYLSGEKTLLSSEDEKAFSTLAHVLFYIKLSLQGQRFVWTYYSMVDTIRESVLLPEEEDQTLDKVLSEGDIKVFKNLWKNLETCSQALTAKEELLNEQGYNIKGLSSLDPWDDAQNLMAKVDATVAVNQLKADMKVAMAKAPEIIDDAVIKDRIWNIYCEANKIVGKVKKILDQLEALE